MPILPPIRVAVADDHPAVIIGVASQVISHAKYLLAGSARNSSELISLLDTNGCDLLILDYMMPGGIYGDGLVLIGRIRRRYPDVKIIVFTMIDTPRLLREILGQGVIAIVSKKDTTSHLVCALDKGAVGSHYLSPSIQSALDNAGLDCTSALSRQESTILHLLESGMPVGEIAEHLNQSQSLVDQQKRSAMDKLGIASVAELRMTQHGGAMH